jgi:hypothetical protein
MPFDRNPKLGSQFPISTELVRQSGLDYYFLISMEGRVEKEWHIEKKEWEERKEWIIPI